MNEQDFVPENPPENPESAVRHPADKTTIHVNEYGSTHDEAVVIEEADRTVLLTKDQTLIIPKEQTIDIAPKNRPRKIYGGMWGPTEIATVGVSLLAVLLVVLLFVFLVMPAQNELAKNRAERDRIEAELKTANSKYGTITSTEQGVANLVKSADDFETRFLPVASNGRSSLYQRINGLIGAYNLVNTSGPDYAPLDNDGRNDQSAEEAGGKAKFKSIFPGVYVTMTVEGSYQNLRRFIKEIETSQQFVVISSVELEPSESKEKQAENQTVAAANGGNYPNQFDQIQRMQNNQIGGGVNPIAGGSIPPNGVVVNGIPQPQNPNQPNQPKPSLLPAPRGKTHGEIVSLHLEMAAYFRRPNFVPMSPDAPAAP